AHLQLGIAYDYLGRTQEACEEYQQAVKLNPDDPKAHFYLAAAYVTLHNKPAALTEYEAVRKIDPGYISESFEEFALSKSREHGKEKLYFIPLNHFSAGSLQQLITFYRRKIGIDAIPMEPLPLRLAAIDNRRQQLVAEEVIELMKRTYP